MLNDLNFSSEGLLTLTKLRLNFEKEARFQRDFVAHLIKQLRNYEDSHITRSKKEKRKKNTSNKRRKKSLRLLQNEIKSDCKRSYVWTNKQ